MEMYDSLVQAVCTECGIAKYPENFPFRNGKDGKRRNQCVECRKSYQRMRYLEKLGKFKRDIRRDEREADPKKCIRCGEEKPLSDYTFHNRNKGQHRNFCHECEKKWIREYHKSPQGKEKNREWREGNRERIEAYYALYRNDPRYKDRAKQYGRKHTLKMVGTTQEDYDRMFHEQRGKCAICGSETNGRKQNFCVDHNHETGEVRGLLCHSCNVSVGLMKDSPELLQKAIDYLNRTLGA